MDDVPVVNRCVVIRSVDSCDFLQVKVQVSCQLMGVTLLIRFYTNIVCYFIFVDFTWSLCQGAQ